MRALVLDTGALIAYERGDQAVASMVGTAYEDGRPVITSSGCVAQAWRKGGPKQAVLVRLLRNTQEVALGPEDSRAVGELCSASKTSDVIDAHVALLAEHGDTLLTSDTSDIETLLQTTKVRAVVASC
ncbi:MAG: PIN domain-containing protein [Acidimicrobiales bacterium]